jgi:hypothetical protein
VTVCHTSGVMWGRSGYISQHNPLRERHVMKLHCLLGHQWTGCKCDRCHKTRDSHHDWDHCRCRLCGLFRDHEHDLEASGCRLRCRRCHLERGWKHDWQGCLCTTCGAERHEWRAGVCEVCNERCHHPADRVQPTLSEIFGRPAYDPPYREVCFRCGERVKRKEPHPDSPALESEGGQAPGHIKL